jgi:hypothetical protein
MKRKTNGPMATSRGRFLAGAGSVLGAGALARALGLHSEEAKANDTFPAWGWNALFEYDAEVWFYDDLFTSASGPLMGMEPAGIGTGAGWTSPNEAGRFGVWVGGTGSTSSGRAELRTMIGSAPFPIPLRMPDTWMRIGALVKVPTLSTSGQRFWVSFGLARPGAANRHCLFRYRDDVNGGKWQAYVSNDAGTAWTPQDTGISVVAGTWYQLEITFYEFQAGSFGAEFWIDGTARAAFDEPGGGSNTLPSDSYMVVGIEKTVGTTERTLAVDAYWLDAMPRRHQPPLEAGSLRHAGRLPRARRESPR